MRRDGGSEARYEDQSLLVPVEVREQLGDDPEDGCSAAVQDGRAEPAHGPQQQVGIVHREQVVRVFDSREPRAGREPDDRGVHHEPDALPPDQEDDKDGLGAFLDHGGQVPRVGCRSENRRAHDRPCQQKTPDRGGGAGHDCAEEAPGPNKLERIEGKEGTEEEENRHEADGDPDQVSHVTGVYTGIRGFGRGVGRESRTERPTGS